MKLTNIIKQNKGFTLGELLIVVAIIGVLVAVSIPVFGAQTEKARRAVDIANARSIYAALSTMLYDGTVDLSTATEEDSKGIWVMVQSNERKYKNFKQKTFYVGANKGVTIKGVKKTTAHNGGEADIHSEIEACFSSGKIDLYSKGPDTEINGIKGWDWYIVEFVMGDDGSISGRIYSGTSESSSTGIRQNNNITSIEQWMGRA